jgi:DNA-binding CsgD family transcriptional regulator
VNQIYANARLSERETEVLRLLGDGETTAEIAAKLKLSLKTVQAYSARLKQKLDTAKFNQLIRIAVLWRAGVAEIVVKPIRGSLRSVQRCENDCYSAQFLIKEVNLINL